MVKVKKRFLSLLITAVLLLSLAPAAAASNSGGIAGYFYYTDIVTYLWDVPVNAINIGGETLIDAESMAHYGFEVNWYSDERKLEIIDNGGQVTDDDADSGALLDMSQGKTGGTAGKYYHTDIVTTLGGKAIESYNIGGRTFISAEGMRNYGYSVEWNANARELRITTPSDTTPAVCEPWDAMIFSGAEDDSDTQLEYLYFVAERNPDTENFGIGGSGYAKLSNIILARDKTGQLSLTFSIYQYVGMDETVILSQKLNDVISYKYGDYIRDPATVYDPLNELLQVYTNGEPVKISELQYSQGNGHADYALILDADSSLEKNDISSVAMLCNVPETVVVTIPN